MDLSTSISLENVDDYVYVRGNLSGNNSSSDYTQFFMSGELKVSGNLNTIWNYNNPDAPLKSFCGFALFQNCFSLTDAGDLKLPSMSLSWSCYVNMFFTCINLTVAPELPATTLNISCYKQMFYNCFRLTIAPKLPAKVLPIECYYYMFDSCRLLNNVTCLATDISATNCTQNWVSGVAASGTFTKNPEMTSWSSGRSGIPSGWTDQDYQAA